MGQSRMRRLESWCIPLGLSLASHFHFVCFSLQEQKSLRILPSSVQTVIISMGSGDSEKKFQLCKLLYPLLSLT